MDNDLLQARLLFRELAQAMWLRRADTSASLLQAIWGRITVAPLATDLPHPNSKLEMLWSNCDLLQNELQPNPDILPPTLRNYRVDPLYDRSIQTIKKQSASWDHHTSSRPHSDLDNLTPLESTGTASATHLSPTRSTYTSSRLKEISISNPSTLNRVWTHLSFIQTQSIGTIQTNLGDYIH